jgi:predicted nucleic acid-binding protein
MDSAILGLVLDSSVLIAAERQEITLDEAIENVRSVVGEIPLALCSLTVAEIAHGIYRANKPEVRARRRAFLDELKSTVPIYSITDATAEVIARIGGEQAAKGINLPLGDLIIGACALELGCAVGTSNVRDFNRIPDLKVVRL